MREFWRSVWPVVRGLALGALAVGSILAWVNTNRIDSLTRELDERDRGTSATGCARINRIRAEFQVLYDAKGDVRGLRRVQRNLPILQCETPLEGKPPTARGRQAQDRFVCLYRTNQLKPLPSVEDIPGVEPDKRGLCGPA